MIMLCVCCVYSLMFASNSLKAIYGNIHSLRIGLCPAVGHIWSMPTVGQTPLDFNIILFRAIFAHLFSYSSRSSQHLRLGLIYF